ncbi:MAG: bactofilin family protein [Arenimonas sp.]|uniref:bactofilin family protein n=1 Tax=Arenimonas sp. TaxID=1872635 RepID=UPI003C0985FE
MLGSKKTKLSANGSDNVETLIGRQVVIQGDLLFSGGLYIEGKVLGKVVAEEGADSLLTLAQGGVIEGSISAPKAVISGRLTGDIHSCERIELTETAHIQGNIHYRLIEITAGATVSGQLIHQQPAE